MIKIIIFLIIFLIFYLFNIILNKNIEKFSNSLISDETFETIINKLFKIIDKKNFIKYNNINITGQIGQIILFEGINNNDNKKYIILRYPDFRDEHLRHSKINLIKYFNFIENNFIDKDKNYIFDFTGYHGIIDDKVRMWIKLKEYYGRDIANSIMPKTYLIPNDYDIFFNEYSENKKYIFKNSFGGARSAIKITRSKDEIIDIFEKNKIKNYNPYTCEDASCHSMVKYNIIQEFIKPTFLINGHKIGLRLYLVIIKDSNNNYKKFIWKNGVCYYSSKKYKDDDNIENNVVGSIKNISTFIDSNNLPITYIEFKNYCKKNVDNYENKINNFEYKLKKNISYILNSNLENNKDDLLYFDKYSNIKTFNIFAFDIEFDDQFNPIIFEGNFYFTRSKPNDKYGKLFMDMYNDIFYEMGLAYENKIGFFNL